MAFRRITWVLVVCLGALIGAGCSSGGTSTATTSSDATLPIPSTTNPSTATTLPGAPLVGKGSLQTATDPAGQKLTAGVGQPTPNGNLISGPPNSWAMVFVITNVGSSPFQSTPQTQITLTDASGKSYAPVPWKIPLMGQPMLIAAGQQWKMILFFQMPRTAEPRSLTWAPFGSSVTPLRWTI